jgi:hypothetical protein
VRRELLAGALLALVARGPWVAPGWRHSLAGRAAIALVPSIVYELEIDAQRGQPWHRPWTDLGQRTAATIGVEVAFTFK